MIIKINKTIFTSVVFATMALSCISCNDWLDVNPKSQVKEEALFSSEAGFQDALLGIYTIMGEHETYGGNSTMGLMDILAQTYSDVYANSNMNAAMMYDYKEENVKSCIDEQWKGYYKAVANCNYLLKNVESNGGVMSDKVRRIVKGEALTARAYLIFDAMRGYAPSYIVGKDAKAVPFVDHVTNAPVASLTVSETTEKLIADVLEARELVKDIDPIGPAFDIYIEETEYDANDYALDSGFMLYRKSHFNYYGMTALLARMYLFKGDKANALKYAKEVIDCGRFEFATNTLIDADAAKRPYLKVMQSVSKHEYISSIYVYGLKEKRSDLYFKDLEVEPVISQKRKELLFTTLGLDLDLRAKRFFALNTTAAKEFTAKYMTGTQIPLLKIGEMYLIAAEASGDISYLNTMRKNRGYVNDESSDHFNELLIGEYQRELFAEGQLFYFYKRLNMESIPNALVFAPENYILPVPDDEKEFGYSE
jgi:hypothetical protein